MLLVNLGCGPVWHPAWQNYDLRPRPPHVRRLDVRRPLPLPDGSADAVYHSHVLEHLPPAAADRLLGECRRILRPGGILRVAVPDLEAIARNYLEALDDTASHEFAYDWAVLELLDQCVRETSGGLMGAVMRQATPDQLAGIGAASAARTRRASG